MTAIQTDLTATDAGVALLGFVTTGFLYETLRLGPSVPGSLHGLVPGLKGAGSLYLAIAILGATVMPHVIYLHSALTKAGLSASSSGSSPTRGGTLASIASATA